MANTEAPQPRRRRSGPSWVPVSVAVVTVGLFLGWLVTRQPTESVAVAEPNATNEAPGDDPTQAPATTIQASELQQSEALVGQVVEVPSIGVIAGLGPQLFWAELPGGSPYLVRIGERLVAQGVGVPTGRVQLTGQVQAITDSVLNAWVEQGVLQSANDRAQAEYSTTYIDARRIQPARQ
jgi:hypothetical protein